MNSKKDPMQAVPTVLMYFCTLWEKKAAAPPKTPSMRILMYAAFPLNEIVLVIMNARSEPQTKAMIGTRNLAAKTIKYLAATHPRAIPRIPITTATIALLPPYTCDS